MPRKYLTIFILMVVMVCCVSAASATDVDNITVPDDTNIIADDIVESVDDVEIDDVSGSVYDMEADDTVSDVEIDEDVDNLGTDSKNVIVGENTRGYSTTVTVDNNNYWNYFNWANGQQQVSGVNLKFNGNFNSLYFNNFIINDCVDIDATNATFQNVGFSLTVANITLTGGTFTTTTTTNVNHVIDISARDVKVAGTTMTLNAPSGKEFIGIDVDGSTNVEILNNVINYNCSYTNAGYINYVVRVKNSPNALIYNNTITAYLPLKDVAYYTTEDPMDWDQVAAIGIEGSNSFNLSYNDIKVNVSCVVGDYPTLDSVIVLDSANSYIGHNNVTEIDNVTQVGDADYLYAIDVYRCNNLNIDNNTIKLRSVGGTTIVGTNNGTSTAYGIQLTGGHTVTIKNNNIDTKNNGPNAGIYSQNWGGDTNLTIVNNTIYAEGNAGSHPWSLVTGMELQDNYAYVAGNKITVYNKQVDYAGYNVYGISFSQYGNGNPVFNITNNCVRVINGEYAVYVQYSNPTTYVTNNCLNTTSYSGDAAVYHTAEVTISGNYACSNCTNCTNCPVHP